MKVRNPRSKCRPIPAFTEADISRFESSFAIIGECWIWQKRRNENGYGLFYLQSLTFNAHRASYRHYKGIDPGALFVCHSCDIPACVNPDHLWTGFQKDNMADAKGKGRNPRGSRHGVAKLTERDVFYIRKMLSVGIPHEEISRLYHVSTTAIGDIARGRLWAHVP